MKEKLANRQNIRTVEFCGLQIGGEKDFNYINGVKPLFALDLKVFDFDENFEIVKSFYKNQDVKSAVQLGNSTNCDILSLTFNVKQISEIPQACELLMSLLPIVTKPLMIRGSGSDEIDKILLPELLKILDREVIISTITEANYQSVVKLASKFNHVIIIKTPIDINLAKEMNILCAEEGQDLNKILIDTDIGGLGYGLDYGYSIMEKIKMEGFCGDEYLNLPLVSFVGEESLKTKEAKSEDNAIGELSKRALMIEISSVSSVVAAGANLVVVNHPETLNVMKRLV